MTGIRHIKSYNEMNMSMLHRVKFIEESEDSWKHTLSQAIQKHWYAWAIPSSYAQSSAFTRKIQWNPPDFLNEIRPAVLMFITLFAITHKDERKGELCVGCLFGKLRFYTNIFSLKCDNHIQWIILVSWMNLKSKTNVRLESSSSFVVIISKTLFWWTALIFLELLFFVLLLFPLYLTMNTKFRSEIFRSVELLI